MILLGQNIVKRVFISVVPDLVVEVYELLDRKLWLDLGVFASEASASEFNWALNLV